MDRLLLKIFFQVLEEENLIHFSLKCPLLRPILAPLFETLKGKSSAAPMKIPGKIFSTIAYP
jgi:hypothetical protein